MNNDSYTGSQKIVSQNDKGSINLEEKINEMWGIIDDLKHKVAEERELLRREKYENEALMKENAQIRQTSSMLHLSSCPGRALESCPVHPYKSHHTLPSKNNLDLSPEYSERISLEEDLFNGDHNKYHFRELLQRLRNQEHMELGVEEDLFPEVAVRQSSSVTRDNKDTFTEMKDTLLKDRPQTQPSVSGTLDVEVRERNREGTQHSLEPNISNQC